MSQYTGIRVLNLPESTTQRDIKVYFSSPRHGGSKIQKIYYPLKDNDAVIIFADNLVNQKIFQLDHTLNESEIKVVSLQRQVFSKVTVELCPDIKKLLDEDPKYLDDIQYDGELIVTSGDNYAITGDWYQIEWVQQYLTDALNKLSGNHNGMNGAAKDYREVRNRSPVLHEKQEYFNTSLLQNPYVHGPGRNEYGSQASNYQSLDYGLEDRGATANLKIPNARNFDRDRQETGFLLSHKDFGDVPLAYDFKVASLSVSVDMNDILKETTDAIVTSASPKLSTSVGLSRIIAKAAGALMKEECREYVAKYGKLNIADVIHTSAGGALDEKVGFIIHAVSPQWYEDDKEASTHLLTCTYINVFQYASQMWLKSIATPLIGAGSVGFPLDICIQAFYDALLLFVINPENLKHLKNIRLVINDADSTCSAIAVVQSIQDEDFMTSQTAARERYIIRCDEFAFSAKDFGVLEQNSRQVCSQSPESYSDEKEMLITTKTDGKEEKMSEFVREEGHSLDVRTEIEKTRTLESITPPDTGNTISQNKTRPFESMTPPDTGDTLSQNNLSAEIHENISSSLHKMSSQEKEVQQRSEEHGDSSSDESIPFGHVDSDDNTDASKQAPGLSALENSALHSLVEQSLPETTGTMMGLDTPDHDGPLLIRDMGLDTPDHDDSLLIRDTGLDTPDHEDSLLIRDENGLENKQHDPEEEHFTSPPVNLTHSAIDSNFKKTTQGVHTNSINGDSTDVCQETREDTDTFMSSADTLGIRFPESDDSDD